MPAAPGQAAAAERHPVATLAAAADHPRGRPHAATAFAEGPVRPPASPVSEPHHRPPLPPRVTHALAATSCDAEATGQGASPSPRMGPRPRRRATLLAVVGRGRRWSSTSRTRIVLPGSCAGPPNQGAARPRRARPETRNRDAAAQALTRRRRALLAGMDLADLLDLDHPAPTRAAVSHRVRARIDLLRTRAARLPHGPRAPGRAGAAAPSDDPRLDAAWDSGRRPAAAARNSRASRGTAVESPARVGAPGPRAAAARARGRPRCAGSWYQTDKSRPPELVARLAADGASGRRGATGQAASVLRHKGVSERPSRGGLSLVGGTTRAALSFQAPARHCGALVGSDDRRPRRFTHSVPTPRGPRADRADSAYAQGMPTTDALDLAPDTSTGISDCPPPRTATTAPRSWASWTTWTSPTPPLGPGRHRAGRGRDPHLVLPLRRRKAGRRAPGT